MENFFKDTNRTANLINGLNTWFSSFVMNRLRSTSNSAKVEMIVKKQNRPNEVILAELFLPAESLNLSH